jgi:hypothetical protein
MLGVIGIAECRGRRRKKMTNRKTINVEPYHVEWERQDNGGFTLVFSNEKYKIKMHFKSWWVKHIARILWMVVGEQQSQVDANIRGMTRGIPKENP